ncbi:MAG TPA: CdaR family protein [Chloroflexota bacterium]
MRLPFTIDSGRAFFAVALSVLLYFVALSETNPADQRQTTFSVPVQTVNVPPGLVVTTQPPAIRLWVTAPLSVFNRLRAESFTAQVDATGASAGDNDLSISVSSTDPEVRGVQPDQASVRLHLEEVRDQVLPVRVNPQGQVAAGYQAGAPSVDPPRVTVSGAASIVGRASEAVVDVNVDHLTVSVNGVFTPRIVDDRGNDLKDLNLRATPQSVTVQMPISQQTLYKQVGVRPITQGQPAPGYALQPLEVNPPTTTLVGDPAGLDAVNFVDTVPIDINGISTTIVRSVTLARPDRALLLQDGQTVTVTVRVTTLPITQTVRVPPSVINLSGTVQLARPLDLVSVSISGPAPALQNLALNPNDFKVVVDASGKGPGRYALDVKVQQVPAGLNLQDFGPKQVQVDLTEAPTPTPAAVPSPTPAPPAG